MTFAQLIQNQEQQEQAHHTHNASTEKLFEMQANVLEKLSFQVGNWSDKLEAGLNDTNATLAMLMHKQEQQVQVDHTHNARTERLFNKMQANFWQTCPYSLPTGTMSRGCTPTANNAPCGGRTHSAKPILHGLRLD